MILNFLSLTSDGCKRPKIGRPGNLIKPEKVLVECSPLPDAAAKDNLIRYPELKTYEPHCRQDKTYYQ